MYKTYTHFFVRCLIAGLFFSCGKTPVQEAGQESDALETEIDPYNEAIDDGYAFIYEKIPTDVHPKVFTTLPLESRTGLFVSVFMGKSPKDGEMDNGFAVWKKSGENKEILWFADGFKDNAPHTFSMADINLDGIADIVCYIGEEKNFNTLFYLGNQPPEKYSPDNYKLALRSKYAYSAVLDLDFDGKPEILDLMSHESDMLGEMEKRIPKGLMTEINAVYHKAAKGYEETHFTYNHSDFAPYFNLFITEPFRIWKFENGAFAEKTETYKQHLKWRRDILERVLETATEKEKENLAVPIAEINGYLAEL